MKISKLCKGVYSAFLFFYIQILPAQNKYCSQSTHQALNFGTNSVDNL